MASDHASFGSQARAASRRAAFASGAAPADGRSGSSVCDPRHRGGWRAADRLRTSGPLRRAGPSSGRVGVLALLTLLGDFIPFRLPRQRDHTQLSASSLFGFSLLVLHGPGAAVAVFAIPLADLAYRKGPVKTAFNAAPYALSMAAAGAVLGALTDLPAPAAQAPFAAGDVPALAVAGSRCSESTTHCPGR